ncbi:MAG TPA: hypothetical protein VNN74_07735 [Candidatus Micrarchaeia archaeon]|nr:hypothetical protein [Candidatus Micrarchaeia archaeon]
MMPRAPASDGREVPGKGAARAPGGAARAAHPLATRCPRCEVEMVPEHAHYRCPRCGTRDSCCM